MNSNQTCFINLGSHQEKIFVSDAQSAQLLKNLFLKLGNKEWIEEVELQKQQAQEAAMVAVQKRFQGAQEFKLVLISGAQSFRSQAFHLSADGIELKIAAPAHFLGKTCMAYLSPKGSRESLEIAGTVNLLEIGAKLSFLNLSRDSAEKISEWSGEAVTV